jgi:hypothetical protein
MPYHSTRKDILNFLDNAAAMMINMRDHELERVELDEGDMEGSSEWEDMTSSSSSSASSSHSLSLSHPLF